MPLNFEIAHELMPYVADATVRFRYLNPGIDVTIGGTTVVVGGNELVNVKDLEQQFMFCLYRQKIYSETLPLRHALLAGVTGR
ncbi:hypothetical protein HJB89_11200 [Rhizobium sp. NZLR8]|uniref:hypothetical protein n=1 Tax=Rhizobium sp. NZLR8 TaxID=2731104 RepID=UPI001C8341EA|nr:hypothetical protein [Rhizobium sp. NZLR8]MBX5157688.1 hypothetical protein [Rhizobium sp. NZLR8]